MKIQAVLQLRTVARQARHFCGCMVFALFVYNQWSGFLAASLLFGLGLTVWHLPIALTALIALVALVYAAWVKFVLLPLVISERSVVWAVNGLVFAFLLMGGALAGRVDPLLSASLALAASVVPLYQLQKNLEWTRLINYQAGW